MTIEDQVRFSYYTPAPHSYISKNTFSQHMVEPKRGGMISDAHVPSALDHAPKSKAHVPGPGSYHSMDNAAFALPEGGRLNRNAPVQKQVYHDDYPTPDPGHYGAPHDPSRPRQLQGQFPKNARVSKFIMDEVNAKKMNPGPGAHDVMESMENVKPFCPEGGRALCASRPPTYAEMAPKRWEQNPSPDAYNLPGSINANKAVGKLVYKYESATMAETRDMVTRLNADEGPAPGDYEIPSPQPLTQAPSLRGRTLPHAMPHPFAYNCAPDTAGRYVQSLNSGVLSRNSSEQIFGTGVRRGASSAKAVGKNSRPSSAGKGEHLSEKELKASVAVLASEQPEAEFEWKAGGFAALKKSKSAGSVKAEHPSVLAASRCYPKLQRKHRDGSQFLPMASRRSENVSTHDASAEVERIRAGKWQLGALAAGIQKATNDVLVPLDEERLKREALQRLEEKAKERMRLEGVSKKQQQAVLEEMRRVLAEKVPTQTASPLQRQQAYDALLGEESSADFADGVDGGEGGEGGDGSGIVDHTQPPPGDDIDKASSDAGFSASSSGAAA